MKKRAAVRALSFSLLIVLILTGTTVSGYALASRYRNTIEYTYERALGDLSDYIDNIKTTMTKGLYASTGTMQNTVAAKLVAYSEGAKTALSELPVSGEDISGLQKYLTQLADFSASVIRSLPRNGSLSKQQSEIYEKLHGYIDDLSIKVSELAARYGDGSSRMGKSIDLKGNLKNISETFEGFELSDSFGEIDESFVEYPSLLYDGPFADNVLSKKPEMTKDAVDVDKDRALGLAADFLNIEDSGLKLVGERGGAIPAMSFSGGDIYISVSKKGGFIVDYKNSREIGEAVIGFDVARDKALQFFKMHRIDNMSESYYVISDGVCTINFAYKQGESVCYADLVKVGVALDTGEIVSFSSVGYILNHKERNIPNPKLSLSEALNILSDSLKLESHNLAVIPLPGGDEVPCYEFLCKGTNGDRVLVYINTQTGDEEQLFILLQSDGGKLVM